MKSYQRTIFSACLLLVATSGRSDEPLHDQLDSQNYGFGPGVLVQEVRRAATESRFKIVRNYDYSQDASMAWGTGQNWFLMCALRDVAVERGFAQAKVTFEVPDGTSFREIRKSENFADIGKEQLFVTASWLPEDDRSVDALGKDGILPLARTESFCSGFKKQLGKRP